MKCKQCNKEFKPKRKTAVYCSNKCRKLAFQKVSVLEKMDAKNAKNENAKNAKKINNLKELKYLSDEWVEEYINQYTADGCNISLEEARAL